MGNITISISVFPWASSEPIGKPFKFKLPFHIERMTTLLSSPKWALVIPVANIGYLLFESSYSEIKKRYKYYLNHEYNFNLLDLKNRDLIVKQIKAQGFKEIA
jgi:hypothetical protein